MAKECEKLRADVDELREQRDAEVEAHRTRLEDEYRASLRGLQLETQQERERLEAKVVRIYSQKAQETRIIIGHQQEEENDKKQLYMRELKEKMADRLAIEKSRMEMEN